MFYKGVCVFFCVTFYEDKRYVKSLALQNTPIFTGMIPPSPLDEPAVSRDVT